MVEISDKERFKILDLCQEVEERIDKIRNILELKPKPIPKKEPEKRNPFARKI